MKDIKFTQFIFPNGRKSEQFISKPDDIADKAEKLIESGFCFEIENNCGKIWMSCSNHKRDVHFNEFCLNGVDVPVKVDELINKAYVSEVKDE